MEAYKKYRPYLDIYSVDLPKRSWPNKVIETAPTWCSVDLRDGNQALINPMSLKQKLEFFDLLVNVGFKEIEIGFPSAAEVEFDFTRKLIDENLIPSDVVPQVLTQSRSHLIDRTFESIMGAKSAIVHLYNSTSILQREVVFRMDRDQIKEIAVTGTKLIKEHAQDTDTEVIFEYSPESFTGTELDFALEVCEAVAEVWQPTTEKKMILNLPATVELSMPNIYADQIEWFCSNLSCRDSVVLSLHPHNDRGTAVAATELGLLAGADRVECTLWGNGERTGNVCGVTLALNLMTQGVNPGLELSNINRLKEVTERCTQISVPERHPYGGALVFTAFSGSHQDAIRKGMIGQEQRADGLWDVPYLPIDPADIGRQYEPIIRINSQSGKGGVAYIMETQFGFILPKEMHPELGRVVQQLSEEYGTEIPVKDIWQTFTAEFLDLKEPFEFKSFSYTSQEDPDSGQDSVNCTLSLVVANKVYDLKGFGNGPIDAAKSALLNFEHCTAEFRLLNFSEHALGSGSDAEAAAYIQIELKADSAGQFFGVGRDSNTTKASIKALVSALNRALICTEVD